MNDLIVIDDTLPVQGCHFLVRRGWPQIRASIAGAHCLADIMSNSWWAIGFIMQAIEAARQLGESWSRVEALVHVASRILKADLWKQEFERAGGVLEPVAPRKLDE